MKNCVNWLCQKRKTMSENSLLFLDEKKIRSLFCEWGNWDEYLTFHFHLFVFNLSIIRLFIQNVNVVESFKCVSFHPSQRHLIQNIRQCFPRVPLFLPIYHLNWMITQMKRICLKTMLSSRIVWNKVSSQRKMMKFILFARNNKNMCKDHIKIRISLIYR